MKTRIILPLLAVLYCTSALFSTARADDHIPKLLIKPVVTTGTIKLHATQQGGAIALRWQAVDGCDGYRIYHESGAELLPGSYWYDVYTTQLTSLFQDVAPGGTYSFRVAALYGRNEIAVSPPATVRLKDKKTSGYTDTAD